MVSWVLDVAEVRARAAEPPWEVAMSKCNGSGVTHGRIRDTLCMTSDGLGRNR